MTSLSMVATSAPFQSPFYHLQLAGGAVHTSSLTRLYLISHGVGPSRELGSGSGMLHPDGLAALGAAR